MTGSRRYGALAVACAGAFIGCTRAPQPTAAEPQTLAADSPPAEASPPAQERAAVRAGAGAPRGFVLPRGCVPSGKAFACNPLNNAGCKAADGEACDDDTKGGFACYPAPNEVEEGDECNDKEGPSCAAGMSCDTPSESSPNGICRKLCCSSADCAKARCVPVDRDYGTFGFCK
jgi:hypothetical protein